MINRDTNLVNSDYNTTVLINSANNNKLCIFLQTPQL